MRGGDVRGGGGVGVGVGWGGVWCGGVGWGGHGGGTTMGSALTMLSCFFFNKK